MQAIAIDDANADIINENTIEYGYEIDKNVFIVEEDISKRGQFEKHYLCSDGTYVSVTYPEAIHYLDDDNKWQDVDQSLSYDSVTGMYISDKADFDVSFSNKTSTDNIARIERNGYTLSWGIQTINKNGNALQKTAAQSNISINSNADDVLIPSSSVSAIIENPIDNKKTNIKDRLVANNDTFALPKTFSQISYSNIFDETQNVSLKYTVYHNKIEEDIIISERGDLQSVSMNMDVGTLTPVVNYDGSVNLVDSNHEMQFRIGIPYMVDADHNVCNDIQVTAVKNGTSCVITYTPDTEWFESSARVFPILLDPSITTSDYVSNIEDTYVEENSTATHSSEQYLYITRNGGNKRNAIVRITKLPNIDSSMPIICASLSLTMSSAATDYVELKADYSDSPLELYEYDYSLTTGDYFSYTSYSAIDYDDTTITFDVTAHIYEMYADKKFDDENGYAYQGDFVIGYDDVTDTTYVPPFFSSEYTVLSSRPMFVVKYGYALPAGMVNGGIYSFINSCSAAYMSVNGVAPSNDSNIYQILNETGKATTSQKFRLEYVSGTGGYLLRSMSSSSGVDKVVSIDRNGGELATNMNVRLSSATDSIAQEWLIVPVEYNLFKIVPRANMSLTLTVCDINDGTNWGTSSTSPGNIFVKAHENGNAYQQWYVCDNNDNIMDTSNLNSNVETGNYFLGNSYSGRYLHRASGISVNSMCGRKSSLGENTIKWKVVNLGDGYCTIQRSDMPRCYLAPISAGNGSNVRIYISNSETIEENFKWSIRIASGGGCIIKHKVSGMCLTDGGESANPSTVKIATTATPGTDAYNKQVWRVANEDYYVELGIAFSFDDLAIDVGESKAPSINKHPGSASWASYTDFDYTIVSGGDLVSYDAKTHLFTGISPGTITVNATHKVTGTSKVFEITVNYFTVVIPCSFASAASYQNIKSFSISISPYISEYSSYLNGVTWHACDNGVVNFNSQNMTVSGIDTGLAWLEARKDNAIVLICYVYVEDILKNFTSSVQDFLYIDGSFLGTISCMEYENNPSIDPLVLRTEWYLYAITLYNQGKTDNEIKQGLAQRFNLTFGNDDTFQSFLAEIAIGSRGGYSRENLKLSFDGLRSLFNFYWFQYAAYSIATLDTVNVYTSATAQDVAIEKTYAQNLCKDSRTVILEAQQAQTSGGYNADNFRPTLLKQGTIICGMRDGQTAWYTTQECVAQSNYNVITLYDKLQVQVNPAYGYRTKVGYYEVLDDAFVAYGKVLNNPSCGSGGYVQYYIPNYNDILSLIREVNLTQ